MCDQLSSSLHMKVNSSTSPCINKCNHSPIECNSVKHVKWIQWLRSGKGLYGQKRSIDGFYLVHKETSIHWYHFLRLTRTSPFHLKERPFQSLLSENRFIERSLHSLRKSPQHVLCQQLCFRPTSIYPFLKYLISFNRHCIFFQNHHYFGALRNTACKLLQFRCLALHRK